MGKKNESRYIPQDQNALLFPLKIRRSQQEEKGGKNTADYYSCSKKRFPVMDSTTNIEPNKQVIFLLSSCEHPRTKSKLGGDK